MVDRRVLPPPFSFTKLRHSEPYPFISPSRPELSAAGKNIIVTGGGTGIGRAISIAFAQAGAKSVSILGRTAEKLQEGAEAISAAAPSGGTTQVLSEAVDLLDGDKVKAALERISAKVGKIDVLVANAGIVPRGGPMATYDPKDLMTGISDTVLAAFNPITAFLPVASAEPVLLYTSSCMAHWAPIPMMGPYSIAKAAASKLVDFFGRENPNLHVMNIQPGWVATALNGYQKEAEDTPELPGRFYLWLASSEAKFLKGKFVWVNWDAEELVQRADEIQSSRVLNTQLGGVPI